MTSALDGGFYLVGLARLEGAAASDELTMLSTRTMMTRAGSVVGTYPYMSPEQAQGQVADARSDLFSLGIILYEMATGTRPFEGDSPASVMSAILRDSPSSVTDLRDVLPALTPLIEQRDRQQWLERIQEWRDDSARRDIVGQETDELVPSMVQRLREPNPGGCGDVSEINAGVVGREIAR